MRHIAWNFLKRRVGQTAEFATLFFHRLLSRVCTLQPIIARLVDNSAHLMSDKHQSFIHIGEQLRVQSDLTHS